MGTGYAMLKRMKRVRISDLAGQILSEKADKIADLNRKQLLQGKNNAGEPLSPKYSEDPWFKSRESALRYAAWKKKLFPETPFDTPNFIITGYYHSRIKVSRFGNTARFDSDASMAASIAAKTNNSTLGLNKESRVEATNNVLRNPLIKAICDKTGMAAR